MKIYLDDEREAPPGWRRAFWPNEAIQLLQAENVTEISLDHDLGNDERGTGYDVLLWIEQEVALNKFIPPKMFVHSSNPCAREKMERAIDAILRLHRQNSNG